MSGSSVDLGRRRLITLVGSALTLGMASCKRAPLVCADTSTLSSEALTARQALGYLDISSDPTKYCELCQQYVPAADQCGECKVLKGPIHPRGTCRAFVAR
ncbi:MAG TPA: hypothetical protein VGI10_16440 [Polyangiaceae bacterium]|jgi:hypothetical protein